MKKGIVLIPFLVFGIAAGIAIIRVKSNEPPEGEMTLARKMLAEAELIKSSKYAKEQYLKAVAYYDSAMLEWSLENERFILFRNYQRTAELANKSAESSAHATTRSIKNILKTEELLEFRMITLAERMKVFEEKYGSFPMNSKHQEEFAKSKLQYSECVLAFKNKNYILCKSKLDSVENTMNRVFELVEEKLNAYLNEYPKWSAMVEKTIAYSKKHKTYCIVIDKVARQCVLYKDGKVQHRYVVELGMNWIGDKNQQGDKSTPEGLYKVIDKKSNGQTRFYKALMLDYPNADDQNRFLQNKKNGVIKPDAHIGNLIEIHGQGGKGMDWTDGCIALKDEDLDVVFKLCRVGTWVTIVGSTKSINELSDQ
ncbi:MAG: L,D-transpeptidase [Bacteroidales bacterium]